MSFDQHPINVLHEKGAPDFVTRDPAALLALAIAHFEAETGRIISPSQVEMYLLETIAYMLALRGSEEQLAIQDGYVAYARSDWLDVIGAERNTPRLPATHAQTVLRFNTSEPSVSRINIPAGTRVKDSAGQVQFQTLEAAFIEAGQSARDIHAQATDAGIYANDYEVDNLSQIIDPVAGIAAVANITVTSGGAAVEDNQRYRARLPQAFERIGNGLSEERYVADVLGWNARCVDVDIQRPQPGYVNIYPLMDDGAPTDADLTSLLTVFGESNIHQGDYIQAFAPVSDTFSFTLELKISDPGSADAAKRAVQDVLDLWDKNLGGYIAPSQLVEAAHAPAGVVEARIPDLVFRAVADNAWRRCTGFNTNIVVL